MAITHDTERVLLTLAKIGSERDLPSFGAHAACLTAVELTGDEKEKTISDLKAVADFVGEIIRILTQSAPTVSAPVARAGFKADAL